MTPIQQHVRAPRARVYRALLDPVEVATWRVPDEMTAEIHLFDARPGGRFRVSLTYVGGTEAGKTTTHTDTYAGRFVELVPDERVVEELAFETADPALRGMMTITTTLRDAPAGGCVVEVVHFGLPSAVSAADNEAGWRRSLEKLAAGCEGG